MAADRSQPPVSRPLGMIVLPGGAQAELSPYNPAEFLVGDKGKSNAEMVTVTFKIHEGYAAELDKWLASKKFPYRTRTDEVRHAVVRHVRDYLPSLEGEVEGTLIHELSQIDEIVAYWRMQNDFIEHIDRIAEEVTRMLQMPGGLREVERIVRRLKKRIDATKPSYHKGLYQKMFNERFGAYLPKIALASSEYGQDDSAVNECEAPMSEYEEFEGWQEE